MILQGMYVKDVKRRKRAASGTGLYIYIYIYNTVTFFFFFPTLVHTPTHGGPPDNLPDAAPVFPSLHLTHV